MIIDTLITDRSQADVDKLNALYDKPFSEWEDTELYYFLYGEAETLDATDGTLEATDGDLIVGEGVVRGAYNADDLNRVQAAVRYLATKFERLCSTRIPVLASGGWYMTSIPTAGAMADYLTDIRSIRAAIGAYADTPQVPASMVKLNYQKANDIERILIDANRRLDNIQTNWLYVGEVYAGEV